MNSELPSDKINADDDLDIGEVTELLGEDDKDDEGLDDKKDKDEETDTSTKDKDDDKDDKDEDTELEEEEDEEKKKEEELDLDEDKIIIPPGKKAILKKYPNFFKDFPGIEGELFKGRQLSEIFPDISSAKEASEKSETYDQVETDLGEGNIERILLAVKDFGDESFNKLADDYLPTLQKVNQQAYLHVVGGVVNKAVEALATASKDTDDEEEAAELLNAARVLNKFMFGRTKFEPTGRLSETKNTEVDKVREERRSWDNQRFETVKNDAMGKVHNKIQSVIDMNIDKKNSMTEYIKKNAVRDAMKNLENIMVQDKSFQRTVDSLWKESRKGNLSSQTVEKVISAYIYKARTLLPGVIQKAKNEALKGIPGKRVERDRSGRLPITGRNNGDRDRNTTKESPNSSGSSTLDKLNALMGD